MGVVMRRFGSSVGGIGLAVVVVASLGVTPAVADSAVPVSEVEAVSSPDRVSESPDTFSAGVQARLQGSRVEDVSQRTQTTKTFANPDGTWTSEIWGSPVQVQDDEGEWADVDLRFKADGDGNFVPRVSAADVVAGGGGSDLLGKVILEDGASVSFTWPEGALPAPSIDGGVATYQIDEDRDVLVTLTSTGMNVAVRLNTPPAPGEGAVELGVVTQGVDLTEDDDELVLKDADGKVIGDSSNLVAWDARTDGGEDPEVVVDVESDLTGNRVLRKATGTAKGKSASAQKAAVVAQRLTLSAPEEFLQDPDTVYPVVVDPTVSALTVAADTWVRLGNNNAQGSDYRLMVGARTDNTNQAVSLVKWNLPSNISGATVTAANMQLFQYFAGSCSAAVTTQVYPLSSAFSNATLWSNRPAPVTGTNASTTFADNKGGDGCSNTSNGWVSVSVKQMVQDWASSVRPNHGLQLNVPSTQNTNPVYEKRFCSYNPDASSGACSTAARTPKLSVSYSKMPAKPTNLSFTQTGTVAGWTNAPRPTVSAKGTDLLGDNVRYELELHTSKAGTSDSLASSCVTALVASGATASCQVGTALTSGTYYLRGRTTNGYGLSSYWEGWTTVGIDLVAPAPPVITATAYTNGQWLNALPTSNSFSVSASATDLASLQYHRDDEGWTTVSPSGGSASTTFSWNPYGAHRLVARAVDQAGNTSTTTFVFGNGYAVPVEPREEGVKTSGSTRVVTYVTGGPAIAATAKVQYRAANDVDRTWKDAVHGPVSVETLFGGAVDSATTDWDVAATLSQNGANRSRRPMVLEVQTCFTYPYGQAHCSWDEDDPMYQRTVMYVPHAFGDVYPTAEAGPGTVSLWTGEFTYTATDVSVPGYTGDLSVSRTYNSFGNPNDAGVFGPGWVSSFDGVDVGVAGVEVFDDTADDGTIALVDSEGEALIYEQPGLDDGSYPTAQKVGVYLPLDEETAWVGAKLEIRLVGGAKQLVFTEDDGTNTVWKLASGQWQVHSVSEPGNSLTTTYTHTAGKLTRIVAPSPVKNGNPIACPETGTPAGCRVLKIDYATTKTATVTTPGDIVGQVKSISYTAYKPTASDGSGAMATVTVAQYKYDFNGRLVSVTDPRSNLVTQYGYGAPIVVGGLSTLTSITPATVATQLNNALAPKPFQLSYASGSMGSDYAGALVSVSRPNPTGTGTTILSKFGYGLPLTATGMPDLSDNEVSQWGQDSAPTHGFAVWGQDRASTVGTTPSAEDLRHADLFFTDDEGRVINTAVYGAGDWQPTSTTYDTSNQVVREIDERGTALIKEAILNGQTVNSDHFATITRYNTEVKASSDITIGTDTIAAGTVLTPAGTLITDVWEPVREVREQDGTISLMRRHTHTDYDEGAPTQGINPATKMPWRQPTTVTVTSAGPDTATWDPEATLPTGEPILSQSRTGYDPIDGTSPTGSTSGWTLGAVTTSTTVLAGGGQITAKTRYDDQGRMVEQRQPKSNGSDEGTIFFSYYTADAQSSPNQACGGGAKHAAWAGLTCRTWYGGSTLPVEHITRYNHYLAVEETIETKGTTTRTTTSTFDTVGRQLSSTTVTSGLVGSTSVPKTMYYYSGVTGDLATTATVDSIGTQLASEADTYDAWGRLTSHVSTVGANSSTTSTTYDAAGRVATVTDPHGTTAYGYNTTNDYRGFVTSQTVTGMGEWTATYNGIGDMITQTSPGGLTQTNAFDRTGQQTTLTYATSTGIPIAAWTTGWNNEGKKAWINGPASVGGERTVTYTYDRADRLTKVTDATVHGCEERYYDFDANGNRTLLDKRRFGGSCTSTGGAWLDPRTWEYDAADRVVYGSDGIEEYEYDALGRQTSIPDFDTVAGGSSAGPITIGYYDNDLARSIQQSGGATTFTLDALSRRSAETRPGVGGVTETVTHGYSDTGDNPAWATTTKNGTSTLTRYTNSIAGDLGAQLAGTTLAVDIIDPWDSVAATITVENNQISAISGLSSYDEYGNTPSAYSPIGDINYGWKGGKERATHSTGLTLMGVRLYNPVTGLFTSTDPVRGGNTTAYAYPQDPINKHDLTGKYWTIIVRGVVTGGKWVWRGGKQVLKKIKGGKGKVGSVSRNLSPHKKPTATWKPKGVPGNWPALPARNGKGWVYQDPLSKRSVRLMAPTKRYKHGYVRFTNKHGQPLNAAGKPGSRADTHFPISRFGRYTIPTGWIPW